ncbi:hypothetical protein ACA910_009228 [Epithemia clementina (nom. ined.)]
MTTSSLSESNNNDESTSAVSHNQNNNDHDDINIELAKIRDEILSSRYYFQRGIELQNTGLTDEMISKLDLFFRDKGFGLPELHDTLITDKGGQAIMDITASTSNTKRNWFHFDVSYTNIGDVGVQELFRAFMATSAHSPKLMLSEQRSIDDDAAISIAKALIENPSWSELSLVGELEIGKERLQALASALHGNTKWERLALDFTKIGNEGAKVLADALEQNKKWKELDLRAKKFDMEGVRSLANALAVNPSWSKLNLSDSEIGTRGLVALANAMLNNSKWESLVLYGTKIGDDGAIALAQALHQNDGWRVLDLYRGKIGIDGAKALATALHGNTHWEYLIVNVGGVQRGYIEIITEHLSKTKDWKRFVVHFCWTDEDGTLLHLAQAIAQRQQPRAWKSLVLWFPGKDKDAMKALAQNLWNRHPNTNPNIRKLFVTDETVENAIKMADYLGQCWQEMDIFFLDIKGIYAKENNAIVQVTRDLHFGRTMSLHNTQLTYQSAIMLAEALSRCDSWRLFSISYSKVGDKGAEALARALQSKNSRWLCLDLSNTAVGNQGAIMLGSALNGNNTWMVLSIASTPITDRGASILFYSLVAHEWRVLDVGFTQIGDRGCKSLSRALTEGEPRMWQHLRLSHNSNVSDVGATSVAQVLAVSSSWRHFDVGSTSTRDESLQLISSSLLQNQDWEVVDFINSRLPMNQAAEDLQQVTAANPCWKIFQLSPQGQTMISLGSSKGLIHDGVGSLPLCPMLTNEAIQQEAGFSSPLLLLTNEYGAGGSMDTNPIAVVTPIVTPKTCLELALEHGLSKVIKYSGQFPSKLVELGKQLLDVADSLGHIIELRMEMAGGTGNQLKKLPPHQMKKVEEILSFGVELATAMFHIVKDKSPEYDVFLSFAGEDRRTNGHDYVGMLRDRILLSGLSVFVDKIAMRAGQTSYPLATMFINVLTARVVVSATSMHYVRKKWPMAELLCGLARNRAAGPNGRSPLIMDTMPGCQWVLDPDSVKKRHPSQWLDDLTVLLPTQLPSMQKYEEKRQQTYEEKQNLTDHIKVIAELAINSHKASFSSNFVGGNSEPSHGQIQRANQRVRPSSSSSSSSSGNYNSTSVGCCGCGSRVLNRSVMHL